MLAAFTLLLTAAACAHLFLQGFNRVVISIPDGPHKKPAWAAWFAVSTLLPLSLLMVFFDAEPVQQALHLSPGSAPAWALFLPLLALWSFGAWRLAAWLRWRLRRTEPSPAIVRQTARVANLPRPESWLHRPLQRWETTFDLEVVERELLVPGLDPVFDGFVLAHVADLHYESADGRTEWFAEVTRLVNAMRADVVVFTGDFVNRGSLIDESVRLHATMRGRLATLAVMGNHDYWTNPRTVREACRRARIRTLHHRRTTIERGPSRLTFTGTDMPWGGHSSHLPALLHREPGETLILLSHSPDNAPVAARAGASLVLSGHNHGGQYRLPLIGPLVVPSRTGLRFDGGVYQLNRGACVLHVSRGVGASGRGRILCPPEIVRLVLRSPQSPASSEKDGKPACADERSGSVLTASPQGFAPIS